MFASRPHPRAIFPVVHERKRYFNRFVAINIYGAVFPVYTIFSRGKFSTLRALWKIKHSSALSSCMASYNKVFHNISNLVTDQVEAVLMEHCCVPTGCHFTGCQVKHVRVKHKFSRKLMYGVHGDDLALKVSVYWHFSHWNVVNKDSESNIFNG